MIAVLPAQVIDQIAAGEVIERPASVVKELVDNAIDAGARTISIETAAGGRALIRVSDDGSGMSAEDAVRCLERHATSKLRTVDDLWGLASMGFRGEALPSIASVSRMTLTTRRDGDLAATRVVVEASKVISVDECGAPVGTTLEVADLLRNLPARLKFLKAESTEATHITELVGRVAMSHPALHLRLKHNGRTALEVPPDRDGFARAQALLGGRIAARIVPATGEESGVRVTAYLGAPELAQATARGVQLFVGKRPIRDRGLLHAITMGYGELVPRGRYPIAVVLLELPAGAVDFNVHPQKHEVRFVDANAVHAAVRHVVQAGVAAAPWRAELGGASPMPLHVLTGVAPPALPLDGTPATPLAQRYAAQLRQRSQGTLGFDDDSPRGWAAKIKHDVRASRAAERAEQRAEREAIDDLARAAGRELSSLTSEELTGAPSDALHDIGYSRRQTGSNDVRTESGTRARSPTSAPTAGYFSTLTYLGQLDLTYLVCDGGGELVLIDQHAAHERVVYERLMSERMDQPVESQSLLMATPVELPPAVARLLVGNLEALELWGFAAEEFGDGTLMVRAVPSNLETGQIVPALLEIADHLSYAGGSTPSDWRETMLTTIACHSAIRAGKVLTHEEMRQLLQQLERCDMPRTCPHGRPTMLQITQGQIERQFGRKG